MTEQGSNPSDPQGSNNENPWQQPQQPGNPGYGSAPYGSSGYGSAPYGSNPYQQTPPPGQPIQPVYSQGCLSAAWSDITATPGWGGKLCILGLLECVPILNFVVAGYGLRWSREVPFGVKAPMPNNYISGKNFELGFYQFLISLVFGLVSAAISGFLGFLPGLGGLIGLAVTFFASMFIELLSMRMAMMQSLGEGFSIGKAWTVMQRNWSSLLIIVLVPSLIVGLIVFVIAVIGVLLMGAGGVGAALTATSGTLAPAAAMALLSSFSLFFIIVLFVSAFCQGTVEILMLRATAHWVARYAPEWVNESWRAAGWRA